MRSSVRGVGGLPAMAAAAALAACVLSGPSAEAQGVSCPPNVAAPVPVAGPGPGPGFQGFGLGYHLGYGYGGKAYGVGPDGGYPFYGGPGYPHPGPPLRRFGRIPPFPHYAGPGYPTPDCPNYFGPTGPLVADQAVVMVGDDSGGYGGFS